MLKYDWLAVSKEPTFKRSMQKKLNDLFIIDQTINFKENTGTRGNKSLCYCPLGKLKSVLPWKHKNNIYIYISYIFIFTFTLKAK